jgi:transglutaminase-like putative cysteine protease
LAPAAISGDFLAEPVLWEPGRPAPAATYAPGGPREWRREPDGTFRSTDLSTQVRFPYCQATRPNAPATRLRLNSFNLPDLCGGAPARLRDWTADLLDRLAAAGTLDPATRDDRGSRLPVEHHAAVARALERHLTASGEYRWSLRREQIDPNVDPVEDFLQNTRAGHCERFATALALMLRSQGVPARIVLGFKGCLPTAEEGIYEVRGSHAHAWVEAFVAAGPPEPDGYTLGEWIVLDPTPAEAPDADVADGWLGAAQQRGEEFFKEYILGYDAEQRRKAWETVTGTASDRWTAFVDGLGEGRPGPWAMVLGLASLVGWRVRARFARRERTGAADGEHAGTSPTDPLHARLLAVLAARGIRPRPGQTPLEFAAEAGLWLRGQPGIADELLAVPAAVVSALYRVRFAETPLGDDERARIDAQMDRLEAALAAAGGYDR